jgi:hypothetical protein
MANTDITIRPLSGSTDGRPIKVVQTATAGTLIHTAQASATDLDVFEIQVYNADTADRTITFECGGVSSPDDHVKRTIPAGETVAVVVPPLRNSLVLRAFGSAANVLIVSGFVRRVAVT